MAIYLSRKKGGVTPTSITPSNSSPAALTANSAVTPTANGYAIASYNSVTPGSLPYMVRPNDIIKFEDPGYIIDMIADVRPSSAPVEIQSGNNIHLINNGILLDSITYIVPSSTPTSVSSGDNIHIGGSGVIVDSIPTPTSITPSNSTPASLTSGSAVTPTANGYAIQSYDSVTPSSTPTSVSTDDIVKIGGSGVIVDSIPTPTSITPSNSSPVALTANSPVTPTASGYAISSYSSLAPSNSSPATITSGEIYKATANGKAVSSVTDITPSNSSPVSLSSGTIYKPSASGYAISSYSSKTPSDSSPASVSSGAIIKASSAGYLYSSSGLGKCKAGTFTTITTGSQTINLGFQPKYIMVMSEGRTINVFDYSYSSTKAVYAATNTYPTEYTISGNTSNNRISAISSTGFTFNKSGTAGATEYYFAMG